MQLRVCNNYFWLQSQWLKFRYYEKAAKIWKKNLLLCFDVILTNFKKGGRVFKILWPSHNKLIFICYQKGLLKKNRYLYEKFPWIRRWEEVIFKQLASSKFLESTLSEQMKSFWSNDSLIIRCCKIISYMTSVPPSKYMLVLRYR